MSETIQIDTKRAIVFMRMVASISARTAKEAAKKANPAIDRLTPTKSTPTLSMTFLGTQFPDTRPGNKTLLNWLKKGIFADCCHGVFHVHCTPRLTVTTYALFLSILTS